MMRAFADMARLVVVLGAFYALACALGLGLLVLAFQVGLLAQVDILFYRGLLVVGLAFLATFAVLILLARRWRGQRLGPRDAFAAAVLSLSFNTCFLVVVPVTVDRSISIFMLGQMAAAPDQSFTPEAMADRFVEVYVGERRQIERRLGEQATSGNVEKTGDGFRITPRGKLVVAAARLVAAMFDSHAGLLASEPVPSPSPAPASR